MSLNPNWRVSRRIKERIHPRVLVKTAAYTVTNDDLSYGGALLSNKAAAGSVTFTLPSAMPGQKLLASVNTAQNFVLKLAATDVIVGLATAGQNFTSNTAGGSLHLECAVQGEWTRVALFSTWTAS